MRFVLRMLVSAATLFGVAYLSGGALLEVDSPTAAVIAAVVLAIVNAVVKPVVHLVALPVTIVTLGLFALVVNALMLYLVAWLVPGLAIVGFWQTVLAAVVISLVTSFLTKAMEGDER